MLEWVRLLADTQVQVSLNAACAKKATQMYVFSSSLAQVRLNNGNDNDNDNVDDDDDIE